jgi:hypothetical protein
MTTVFEQKQLLDVIVDVAKLSKLNYGQSRTTILREIQSLIEDEFFKSDPQYDTHLRTHVYPGIPKLGIEKIHIKVQSAKRERGQLCVLGDEWAQNVADTNHAALLSAWEADPNYKPMNTSWVTFEVFYAKSVPPLQSKVFNPETDGKVVDDPQFALLTAQYAAAAAKLKAKTTTAATATASAASATATADALLPVPVTPRFVITNEQLAKCTHPPVAAGEAPEK